MAYGSGNEMQMFETALEAADLAWWWMELPSGVVFFSPKKAHMLGRDPNEFVHYKNFTDLIHPDDYERSMQDMREHLEGRAEIYETKYRLRCSDGSYRTFYDRGRIVRKKPNGEIALAGYVLDVTTLRKGILNN